MTIKEFKSSETITGIEQREVRAEQEEYKRGLDAVGYSQEDKDFICLECDIMVADFEEIYSEIPNLCRSLWPLEKFESCWLEFDKIWTGLVHLVHYPDADSPYKLIKDMETRKEWLEAYFLDALINPTPFKHGQRLDRLTRWLAAWDKPRKKADEFSGAIITAMIDAHFASPK